MTHDIRNFHIVATLLYIPECLAEMPHTVTCTWSAFNDDATSNILSNLHIITVVKSCSLL